MNILDKTRLLQTSILSSLMMGLGGVAYAQVDTTPAEVEQIEAEEEDDFAEEKGEIVVTGSRLRRNEFTSASPLQVIDGELARDLGLVDASDLLGQTTVVQGQQITTGLSTSAGNLSANGPGSATASLRGLNPGRTLVLVNGRRLAPAGVRGAPSAPDLNLIPGSLVQRVDVLLDGASSVYGSDAVAGVINYQLQREFEGIEVDAYATIPELPGNAGHREVFSLKTGVSNDKGFVTFAAEHSRVAGYPESALSDFYSPYSNGCLSYVTQGASGTIYDPDRCAGSFGAGSAISPYGYVGYEEGAQVGPLPPNFVPIGITANLIQPDDADGQRLLIFPEELDAAFAPDFNRTSLFTFGEYDTGLYGNMKAYFEASYATRETKTNTAGQGAIEMPGAYPLNQFPGATTLFFQSRFINDTNVAQTRFISGLKGDLPFLEEAGLNNWAYDVNVSYSRSSGQDSVSGIPFFPRLAQTINNTTEDANGNITCADEGIPGEGQQVACRPLDFFEPSFLFQGEFEDPEDTAYLFPNRLTDTIVKQNMIQGYMSGDLFDVPTGGTVIAGFGGEYREDIIETRTSLAGDFLGFFNDPGSNGRRTLHEVFGEIEVPLVKERYGIHELSVNLAGRYTDESNFGSAETYSVKGVFAPTDWLSFRATYGTSFRAPNLGEQFGGRVTGFANPSDPCRVPGVAVPFTDNDGDGTQGEDDDDRRVYQADLDPRDQSVINNCLNGGGPFGLAATDPFSLGTRGLDTASPVFLGAPTNVASGSNPDLSPETSKAISVGGSFDQPWFEDFDFRVAVNYFEIEINDEVNSLTASTIVNRCYNSTGLTDPTCEFITRDARVPGVAESGEVSFVSALNQNLGAQFVEGIDYNAEFGFDFKAPFSDDQFDYNLIFRATQSLRQDIEEAIVTGVNINDNLGEYGNPKWRLNFTQQLTWKDFGFLFQSRYLDSMVENVIEDERNDPVTTFFSRCVQEEGAGTPDNRTCRQYDDLASYWLHSASISYSKDTYVLRAGVNNVFDTAPPLTDNNNLGSLAGIGYDIGGRTFFVNATKKF